MKTIGLTLLAAGLLCFTASPQEKSATKKKSADAGMSMPKPAAEMKELRALVGTWSSDETFEPSPFMPGGTATGTNTVRLGPGGFTVLMEQRSKSATMGSFAGHGVLTWDPNEKAYKTVWADSMTPGVTVDTGHKEGDNIVYTGEITMGGKKIATKTVIADRTPTSYTLTGYANDGSGEKKTMTIKFTKKEPEATPVKK